jgi:hypothetical protein
MAYTTIDDPSAYFQTALWTGNGSTQSITNDGNSDLQPDWIWTKKRNDGQNHHAIDSTRGVSKALVVNDTDAEATKSNGITAFNSDGFSVGTDANFNNNTNTYVAWQWKANGGTTTTNDASSTSVGNVDSVYQANTTAGFSIVTFDLTSDSGDKTIAHGLGQAPDVIIFKNRDDARNWAMHHHTQSPPQYMTPNTNDAVASSDNFNNSTDPTSTVFSLETSWHGAHKHVAYCFAEVQGYSKFGTYKGNGNTDGPFIYTGFKPAFGIFKRTNSTGQWYMMTGKIGDDGQDGNPLEDRLEANTSAAESDMGQGYDFLSNGIKIRHDGGEINGSGDSFIYMAFAEHPFVSSEGVPVTAR